MKEQILEYIKEWDHVSFQELSSKIPGFDGDYSMTNES